MAAVPELITACPRNCYSTCSMRVEVEDGRLRRIVPLERNRATPEGACLKGLSYVERVHSPERILYPLRRDGEGSFRRISWEEALRQLADQLRRVREDYGPQSVLYYSASGTKGLLNSVGPAFFRLYGGYTTTYGDLCWPAGLEATRLTLGENKHNAPWDLVNARLIVLWGKNVYVSSIHLIPHLKEAKKNGTKLILIDPVHHRTASLCDLYLQPRPGGDAALACGVSRWLFEHDHIDPFPVQ